MIEIIIVIAILGAGFLGIYESGIFYMQSFRKVENGVKANYLAAEAIEAARSFRAEKTWSGAEGIASIATNADYYPDSATGEWLMTAGQQLIDGFYTRRIIFSPVSRDINQDIESIYNPSNDDPNTRKVTAEVSWDGGARTINLVTYITNFAAD